MTAPEGSLACVILAHTDPTQLHRLITALDPFPVYLHVDSRVSPAQHTAMVTGLPERCQPLNRIKTGWAKFENVEAEIAGYRAALAGSAATHIALFTGTDYPLASTAEIRSVLGGLLGRSVAKVFPLPYPNWGKSGGFARLRYRHWAYRKHMLRLPIPRRLPTDINFAGGSQLKVLARAHAQAVVNAFDQHPGLVRFWRRSWVADETFVPSILSTPRFVPNWPTEHIPAELWWIGWDDTPKKSPPWLTLEHRQSVLSRRSSAEQPVEYLFARKFATGESDDLLTLIDATLRNTTGVPADAGKPRRGEN